MRITMKHLECQLERTAKACGWNVSDGWHRIDNKNVCTIGYKYLSSSYGGHINLFHVMNESGGVSTVHYAPNKREMLAFLRGAEYAANETRYS